MVAILLIGKFPPCQGGIASKTYWLSLELARMGITTDVATWVPENARSLGPGDLTAGIRLAQLPGEDPPWHLPGTDLAVERLVTAALRMAETRPPSLVEANYLAPYGTAALIVARALGVPFLLRHAGSDLAKLGHWEPTALALKTLLHSADAVVTNPDSHDELLADLPNRITVRNLPRYAPRPDAFRGQPLPSGEPTILLAGKLNYHWSLKAIDTLLDGLLEAPNWRLLVVGHGAGEDAVRAEVEHRSLQSRVEWRDFVPPSLMPSLLSEVWAVWAVERQGGVEDYSNTVSEALSAGRACFVSHHTYGKPESAALADSPGLRVVDPEAAAEVAACLKIVEGLSDFPAPDLGPTYRRYLEVNLELYSELSAGGASRPRTES